jgi:hypothetical protein
MDSKTNPIMYKFFVVSIFILGVALMIIIGILVVDQFKDAVDKCNKKYGKDNWHFKDECVTACGEENTSVCILNESDFK